MPHPGQASSDTSVMPHQVGNVLLGNAGARGSHGALRWRGLLLRAVNDEAKRQGMVDSTTVKVGRDVRYVGKGAESVVDGDRRDGSQKRKSGLKRRRMLNHTSFGACASSLLGLAAGVEREVMEGRLPESEARDKKRCRF